MKKTLLLSSLAVLAIACTKEPAAPIAGDKAVFDASYAEAPVVKTTLEGSKVLWAASDEISILWVGGSTTAQATVVSTMGFRSGATVRGRQGVQPGMARPGATEPSPPISSAIGKAN